MTDEEASEDQELVEGSTTETAPFKSSTSIDQTGGRVQVAEHIGALAGDAELGAKVLAQAFEMWVNPELNRRHIEGLLPADFALWGAQRLQRPDGQIIIRINDEIRGRALVRPPERAIENGDVPQVADLDGLEDFDLTDDEMDSGHWTVLWSGSRWLTSFNFMTQRASCLALLNKADQFLASARRAFEDGHAAVAVDTLFSACELTSKAHLVSSHGVSMDVKTHGSIRSKLNLGRSLGNVESAFIDVFNRVDQLRGPYRYDAQQSVPMPINQDDLDVVGMVIVREQERLRSRLSDDLTDPA